MDSIMISSAACRQLPHLACAKLFVKNNEGKFVLSDFQANLGGTLIGLAAINAKNASIFRWSHQHGNIFHVAFESDEDRKKALESGANQRFKGTYSVPHDNNTYRVVFHASSSPNITNNNVAADNNNHSNTNNNIGEK
jgi:hypothetical protein